MKKWKCTVLILMFAIFILSVSAVCAADDSAGDISGADDNVQINLEENIAQDITGADDGEGVISETINDESELEKADGEEPVLKKDSGKDDSTGVNSKKSGSSGKNSGVAKEKTKSAAKTKKSGSKKKTDFKTVSKGSKDKAMVKKIQKALKRNGYYRTYKGHYLKVDGWYGPCTERAVKQFQKAKKLKVTGKVDEKTAVKLKLISKPKKPSEKEYSGNVNAKIILYCKGTFKTDCGSGEAFTAKIVDVKTGKGIATALHVEYMKKGYYYDEYYYTGSDGINYITPSRIEVGTYNVKVSIDKSFHKSITSKVNVKPVTKKIMIVKTSVNMKAKDARADSNHNVKLKAVLKFGIGNPVNEGKVKFKVGDKSYTVKVKNGAATKTINLNGKSKHYTATFLGTKNIKVKTVTGKIR